MNTNTSRNGTPLPNCAGSGAPAHPFWNRDDCPVCWGRYRVTKDHKIRAHVSKAERYRVNMEESVARTRAFIAEMDAKYGQGVTA